MITIQFVLKSRLTWMRLIEKEKEKNVSGKREKTWKMIKNDQSVEKFS